MKKGSEKMMEKKTVKKNEKSVNVKDVKKNKHYVAEKKNVKVKKENVFKRIIKYFKGVGKELRRIRWTERKDLLKYSLCTLLFVFFFGIYFYAIDWLVLLVRSLAK